MSVMVKWLTNGEKSVYMVRDALQETVTVYDKIDDIPESIRHYAKSINEPKFVEPDLARVFYVQSVLYPGWPKPCGHPDFAGFTCIAESCIYGGPNKAWEKCPYFGR